MLAFALVLLALALVLLALALVLLAFAVALLAEVHEIVNVLTLSNTASAWNCYG